MSIPYCNDERAILEHFYSIISHLVSCCKGAMPQVPSPCEGNLGKVWTLSYATFSLPYGIIYRKTYASAGKGVKVRCRIARMSRVRVCLQSICL